MPGADPNHLAQVVARQVELLQVVQTLTDCSHYGADVSRVGEGGNLGYLGLGI